MSRRDDLRRNRWLRRCDMALTVTFAGCFVLGLMVAPFVLLPIAALAYAAERVVYWRWRESSQRLFGAEAWEGAEEAASMLRPATGRDWFSAGLVIFILVIYLWLGLGAAIWIGLSAWLLGEVVVMWRGR